jgi:3-phenylpropionate/trans-cinnamate dioxygenase ferredoxin reductase subunit
MFGRRLLGMNRSLPPEKAADPNFDLKGALA